MQEQEQLLVRLSTQVERLILDVAEARKDIKDVRDDIAKRVKDLEDEKVSHSDFLEAKQETEAHEKRIHDRIDENRRIIDFLVSRFWWATGVFAAVSVVFGLISTYVLKHIP